MSREAHEPTKATRDTVMLHATVGTPQEDIARVLGIDTKTLRKYYREDLDLAIAKANATIGGALFNKARSGDTTAMIFWLKTRAKWREVAHHEVSATVATSTINAEMLSTDVLGAILDAKINKDDA